MTRELETLRDILTSSINNILDVCNTSGKPFPSLNDPLHSSELSRDGIRSQPEVAENINIAVAAATQIVATLQSPILHLWNSSLKFTLPVCLGIVEASNVAEIIRDSGREGMHVEDIARKSGVDPKKLERVLRFLATNHYFREVKERTFAHNILSSLLDTGKDHKECSAPSKHKDTRGIAAIAGLGVNEVMLATVAFKDIMLDPETAFSEEITASGFQKALKTNLTPWEYYELPENHFRGDIISLAMSGANSMHPNAILECYNWDEARDGIIVDVGCGTGSVSLQVAKSFPNIQVVLEDRPYAIEHARNVWNKQFPSHVAHGKVHFIATDFFDDQPSLPGPPDIFLLRWILVHWSNKYAIQLLKKLRKASVVGKTKLVIVEHVMDYTCTVAGPPVKEVGAETSKPPPAPLLPNLGGANLLSYAIDVAAAAFLNGGERTIQGFIDVLEASGWKFSYIRRLPSNKMHWSSIVAEPNPDYGASDSD